MLRPLSLLLALAAVVSVAGWLLAPAPVTAAAAGRGPAATPLSVTIDSMSPSTIPRRGPIQVSGSVTNRDTADWVGVNVYAFISAAPLTTQDELAEAVQVPADVEVGSRIIDLSDPRSSAKIDRIAPGESARFAISVPHSQLGVTEQGVYWFGIHALGQGPEGRVDGADGRARTFLPYITETRRSVDTALVVPIRRQIRHAADGSVDDVESWAETLRPGGSLRSLTDLGAAAGSRKITWLVDPAVPDTVRDLVAGNPPRSLEPTVAADADQDGAAEQDPEGSGSSEPSPTPDGPGEEAELPEDLSVAEQDAAAAGATWLDRLHDGLEGQEILTLPYGDVDVAAAAEYDPDTYRAARKRSDGDLEPWGLTTAPAASSPSGFIDAAGIRLVEPATTLLVTDRMFGTHAPAVVRTEGRTLAVSSSGAASGGPGPTYRMAPLAVRQRILAEAAVRLLTPGRKPLIVTLPTTWSPSPVSGFFQGLDLDWLRLTDLSTATRRVGTDVPVDRLRYPPNQAKLELDAELFTAAGDLAQAGETLQNLLTRNDQVGGRVRDEAFSDTSYSARLHPETARVSADRSRAWIEDRLRGVHIDAPKAVILSSGSGTFSAILTNTLDQPVSVRIRAVTDEPLKVKIPVETVEIGAESRTSVLLDASSTGTGIRNLTLLLTDVDNVPIGSSDDLPIRSNQVSDVIWLIMGTGIALLFGAILVRLYRRIKAATQT